MKETKKYKVLIPCFLGKEGLIIELNARQAANLLAGGYIEGLSEVAAVKKGEAK